MFRIYIKFADPELWEGYLFNITIFFFTIKVSYGTSCIFSAPIKFLNNSSIFIDFRILSKFTLDWYLGSYCLFCLYPCPQNAAVSYISSDNWLAMMKYSREMLLLFNNVYLIKHVTVGLKFLNLGSCISIFSHQSTSLFFFIQVTIYVNMH